MGAFLNFVFFPKISGLYQKHRLPWNQLEKLGEVFKNNFLTAMKDLKRRIKAGTAKNRCHTISERSLILLSLIAPDYQLQLSVTGQLTKVLTSCLKICRRVV